MFSHERLKVYDHALVCVANWMWRSRNNSWPRKWAWGRSVCFARWSECGWVCAGLGARPPCERNLQASAVKAAAYLDLCVRKAELDPAPRGTGVRLLSRIALMLRGLSRG